MSEQVNKPSVEDMATYDFMTLLPMFRTKIEELSNRQLKRVSNALAEYPLMANEPTFSYTQERELYSIGCKLSDCRHVIVKAAMELHKEEIEKLMKQKEGEVNVTVQSDLPSQE